MRIGMPVDAQLLKQVLISQNKVLGKVSRLLCHIMPVRARQSTHEHQRLHLTFIMRARAWRDMQYVRASNRLGNTIMHVLTTPSLPVLGITQRFPVRRIYCIGRNYADHAAEMGAPVARGQPMFFMKPADSVVSDGAQVPWPPATGELHHEVEMVVALGQGGRDVPISDALQLVYGYGVGLDLTRRDLQAQMKERRWPWDIAKALDHGAPVSALRRTDECGAMQAIALELWVNGELRQQGQLDDMLFSVADIIHHLSRLWTLAPGDLIFTGTPAGVAALQPGDAFHATLGDIARLDGRMAPL